MELEKAILSACNVAPDLVFIDPVFFAEEWQEKTGLGGCFADLAEQVREQRRAGAGLGNTPEEKGGKEGSGEEGGKEGSGKEGSEALAEEVIRLVLRSEALLKGASACEISENPDIVEENERKERRADSVRKGTPEGLDMVLRCRKMALPLMEWFQDNARILRWRSDPRPYYVWISEIMLQQTRVEAVKAYFDRFVESLPDIKALAECPEEKLLKLWEGLGYYNRVRNLQKAARQVMEEYEGKLPDSYVKLQKLPGIGSYTAGAIASIAYGKPAPAVDGNVLRVLKRLTGSRDDITKPAVKKEAELLFGALAEWVDQIGRRPGDLNQALMELGATVCLPNGKPSCESCPTESLCRIAGGEEWREIPVKPVKKSRRIEERTVFVIVQKTARESRTLDKTGSEESKTEETRDRKKLFLENGERIGLCRRPEKGLLAGLWELPNLEGRLSVKEAEKCLAEEFELEAVELVELGEAKHIFSHVEWRMVGYAVRIAERTRILPPIQMVTGEELAEEYSLPSAFEAYRPELEAESKPSI